MSSILMLPIISGICGLIFVLLAVLFIVKKPQGTAKMIAISEAIQEGARAYLKRQYNAIFIFIVVVGVILGVSISPFSSLAFLIGAILSLLSGYIGMLIGTKANARTTQASIESLNSGLRVAFISGSVMGLTVVSLGILGLSTIYIILSLFQDVARAIELIPAFGFGASSVALFARVGGGIFTKSADVGADLVGKIEAGIPEDDPRNPAVIADNVGDNVGDIAGMGADLYESYVGSIIAPMSIGFGIFFLTDNIDFKGIGIKGVLLPLTIAGIGIISSLLGTFLVRVRGESVDIGSLLMALRRGIWGSSILIVIGSFFAVKALLNDWDVPLIEYLLLREGHCGVYYAILSGLIAGIIIGLSTEYFTSQKYRPTQEISESALTGAATTIIRGISVGMFSTVIPVLTIAVAILVAFLLSKHGGGGTIMGIYGVSIAGIGMLSTLGITLATDAYGPVADNAGGIATQTGLPEDVRERTDALDSLGNTTAATGKGFAIGSAALTAIGLTIAFMEVANRTRGEMGLGDLNNYIQLSNPFVIVGLFIGGMLPFIFCSLTLGAVGKAAYRMVDEVRRQWRDIPGLLEGTGKPDYARCVSIATAGAQKEMILPSLIAVISPVLVGLILGDAALVGLLSGAIVSGFLLAVMLANSGGAWDNAKKFIEAGKHGGKGSPAHKSAVVGDTVGDPFKDTSGPSLNILIKLMSIVSLVFATVIVKYMVW